MITFMVKNGNGFDYRNLELKSPILENLAEDIKELRELPEILQSDYILETSPESFKNNFLKICNRYHNKLAPSERETAESTWREMEVQCPICKTKRQIEIPERIINKAQNIDVLFLKINTKQEILAEALQSLFSKRKILIVGKKSSKTIKNLVALFNFIFQDSFTITINVKTKKVYEKSMELYSNYLIFEEKYLGIEILQDMDEPNKNVKVEKEIIKDFYNDKDMMSSIINLKDRIHEIFLLSQKIIEYSRRERDNKNVLIHPKEITIYLEDTHYIEIKKDYLRFLVDIVKNYFNIHLTWFIEYLADKLETLWSR